MDLDHVLIQDTVTMATDIPTDDHPIQEGMDGPVDGMSNFSRWVQVALGVCGTFSLILIPVDLFTSLWQT